MSVSNGDIILGGESSRDARRTQGIHLDMSLKRILFGCLNHSFSSDSSVEYNNFDLLPPLALLFRIFGKAE
ncbi:MAG: hypothetical protein ACMG6E_09965 [Candidatus Roizmanbacteria bacterium]